MSLAELLLILGVALLVFGPKQLPMVAKHLGRAIGKLSHFKEKAAQVWHAQVKEWQLIDNEEKAAQVDKIYQSPEESSSSRSTKE